VKARFPKGFRFGAVEAAVKAPGRLDLGCIVSDGPAAAAGVFTRNRVVAAPVTLCRQRVPSAAVRAVLVNAGNANACTGDAGLKDALHLCAAAAEALGVDPAAVLPCSTGVIGLPLPVERMQAALPALAAALGDDPEPFARCILTTDTCRKEAVRSVPRAEGEIRVLGIAKGSGMICPDMATMLGFLVTDAPIGPASLQQVLGQAAARTFNRITVDGDTSTNDTVLMLASGAAGGPALESDPEALTAFAAAVEAVCRDLARMIVRDGEGATKLVDVWVRGAVDEAAAERVARTIAHSPLVKTALHGEDPNWGRIAAAMGRSGAYAGGPFDIAVGGIPIVAAGRGLGKEAEAAARRVMQGDEFAIDVRLAEGPGEACIITCDFSAEYVSINADYRS